MGDTDRQEREGTRRAWSVRTRVLTVMLSFMVTGLVVAGTVTFSLQFAELSERVDRDLQQEVAEIRRLAQNGSEGVESGAGEGPYNDLDELFYDYLRATVPSQFESVVTLIDGEPALIPGRARPFELDQQEAVQGILAVHEPGLQNYSDLELDDLSLRMVVSSVKLEGDPREGIFVVAIDIGSLRAQIWDDVTVYALVACGTMLLAGLTGHVMAGRLLRPLTQLREATSAITPEDLTRRVDVSNADNDVAQLGRTFNQMLDRLEAGIVDQRQFLDDAAHELRTPLTIIRGNLELVAADDPEDVAATRDMVLDETDRMQRLVDDLLLLAKAQRPDFVRPEPVDVAAFAEELLDRVHLLGERRWARAGSATGVVRADRQRLQQAAVQLAANAVKFSEPGDSVTVGLSWSPPSAEVRARVPQAAERYLVVSVQDTGAGLEPDQAERVFERFGRGDNASNVEGSGLGLAIVMAIAEAHQGTVTLDSQGGIGSTFRLWLPGDSV